MEFLQELKGVLGRHILMDREKLMPYATDASYFRGVLPLAVALPGSTEEVSRVMKVCRKHGIKVVTRGGGTSLTGASIAVEDSIVINTLRLNRIISTNIVDGRTVAEAGIRLNDLNGSLSQIGFFYPPDPASAMAATLGGTLATNAGGLRAVAYGSTKDWVTGLEVVLPDGEVIGTGELYSSESSSYDFTPLFVGSEGTLGIVTKGALRITPLPESTGMLVGHYSSAEDASLAIGELKRRGVPLLMAEFLDRLTMDAIHITTGFLFPEDSNYMLMIVLFSSKESINRILSEAGDIMRQWNPISVRIISDPKEEEEIYWARRGIGASLLKLRENASQSVITLDIVVPPSELPSALSAITQKSNEYGIKCLLAGHIGDGNIHPALFADLGIEKIKEKAEELMMEIGRIAVSRNGSISGEHGIGLEKKNLLTHEMNFRHTDRNLEIMRKVKKSLDPDNLLNPTKLL